MVDRVVVEFKRKLYFVRPPLEQSVIGALLADDENSNGVLFVAPLEDRDTVVKIHNELDAILENPKLAIVPAKIARLTSGLETLVSPQFEIVGPQKLIVNSDF